MTMSENWKAVSLEWLINDIECQLYSLEDEQTRLWNIIKIKPEKWVLSPLGDLGGGFYVVATWGNSVLWFNDIEDGYNISTYETYGTISEYFSNQNELHYTINYIHSCIVKNT